MNKHLLDQFREEKILNGQGTDKISSALLLIREMSIKITRCFPHNDKDCKDYKYLMLSQNKETGYLYKGKLLNKLG